MNHALQVLELSQVTESLAAECDTVLGATHAQNLAPSFEAGEVRALQELTREAAQTLDEGGLPSLGAVRDYRRALDRASKGGPVDGETLYGIAEALAAMRTARGALEARKERRPRLWQIAECLVQLQPLEGKLFSSLEGSGEVKDSASAELARLRRHKLACGQRIGERIQKYTSGKSRDLLSDPIYTQRDGRYVIPLKAEHRGKIKGIVHDTSASGQTLFIEPEDVLQLGNALREAEAAEREEVARILADLSGRVGRDGHQIMAAIEAAALLDLHLAKARLGHKMNAVSPIEAKAGSIRIVNGRHPQIEADQAIPLTLDLGLDFDALLITGPNTGGKTVAIKTVGLFVLMAQCGLMLPASEVRLGLFSQIWADIGDEQSLQQSLSTFSGHLKNISEALRNLQPGALVLLDEIGAGTDPTEGASLAKALLLAMHKKGAKILASSHYGELKIFAYNTPGFINAAMEFDTKSLRPTYRLMMGAPGASHALKIAERLGVPREIIDQARSGMGVEEQDIARMLEKLEIAQRQAHRAQSEADRLASRLREVEKAAEQKLAEAEESRKTMRARSAETLETTLRELRLEAADIFEGLKNSSTHEAREEAREKLRELQEIGGQLATEFKPAAKESGATFAKGMSVRVEGYSSIGTLLDNPKNGKALVQVGSLKLTVAADRLLMAETAIEPKPKRAKTNISLQRAQYAHTELHLRMMRYEEAEQMLEKFLDEAVLAGLPSVRVVHGKGEGVLRKMTRDTLRRHPNVQSYRDAEASDGGQGATVAVLK